MARSKRKPMSDMNVVPYIDVMLVLLIIFMVTAPMLTQGIKVELPEIDADPIEIESSEEPMIVSVDVNGAYYLDLGGEPTKPLELAELLPQAEKILSANPQISVLIRGDENVPYGRVVDLMARLQELGANGVGLITEDI